MQTLTMVVQSPFPDKSYYIEQAAALQGILDRFENPEESYEKNQADGLTIELLAWGHTLLDEMDANSNTSAERIRELAKPHFQRLNKEILRDDLLSALDPLNPITVTEPVMGHEFNGTLLWNRSVYLACLRACDNLSPFDGKPMSQDPPFHALAKEFIDWKDLLDPQASFEMAIAIARMPTETDLRTARTFFKRLALQATLQRMEESSKENVCYIFRSTEASERETFALLTQAQAQAELDKKKLAEEQQKVKAQYAANLRQLEEGMNIQDAFFNASIKQLEQNFNEAQGTNKLLSESSMKRLEELRIDQKKALDAYQAEVLTIKNDQQLKIKELETKQAAIESRLQAEIIKMQRNHSQTVKAMDFQIGSLSSKVDSAESALSHSQGVTAKQAQEIQGLRDREAHLEAQVAHERRRRKKNECNLM